MRKKLLFFLIAALLCATPSCTAADEYAVGSGTASRSEISSQKGLHNGGEYTDNGEWEPVVGLD